MWSKCFSCKGISQILWEALRGRWNGDAAAKLYSGPVREALSRQNPRKRSFRLLEDNDPSGWKSGKGVAAKKKARIEVFTIPKRSPDLSVMDYGIWKAVNRRMRAQERKFPAIKVETKAEFVGAPPAGEDLRGAAARARRRRGAPLVVVVQPMPPATASDRARQSP